ncbi:hypothetical protein N0V88_003390 [Collariella sp. IMI 366227]|nr:hypothetical protein N0V88_003390 [Collariella sp. IMI 366227]
MTGSKPDKPDSPPKNLHIGAINPFALVEALLGRNIEWSDAQTMKILSSILQTDYEELFDMQFNSILYAGVRVSGDMAERIPRKEMHTLTESDLVTPDFSRVEKLGDLEHMGLKDLNKIKVKHALMSNGNLRLTLEPESLGKTLCNSEMTATLRELCTPFRINENEEWAPPNSVWADIGGCNRHESAMFSNPVQGATSNSWLIAALMSVAWSHPALIQHCTRRWNSSCYHYDDDDHSHRTEDCSLTVKLHSKGGDNDAPTSTVTVNCEVPVNNSSSLLVYCRPSSMAYMHPRALGGWGAGDIWPSLYEKAFAKWLTEGKKMTIPSRPAISAFMNPSFASSSSSASSSSRPNTTTTTPDHPDITQTAHGDPIKAMAQLTDKEPQYYLSRHRDGADLLSLVRAHSVNQRTVYPMAAWTHPTNDKFRGCTLAGNTAYSVLGWAAPQERKQYLVLRHPWGVTEPEGMTSYPGVVSTVDGAFWPPAEMVDRLGLLAIEKDAFQEYFAGMGVAK